MELVKIFEADGPIILTQPHGGTFLPRRFLKFYNKIGLSMGDTDWHINKLFDGLLNSATVIQALFSRYLIDANRDPSGKSLYPKQNSTELCPTKNFLGQSIYKTGMHPDEDEIKNRLIKLCALTDACNTLSQHLKTNLATLCGRFIDQKLFNYVIKFYGY